jgi:hypothetical protein
MVFLRKRLFLGWSSSWLVYTFREMQISWHFFYHFS